MSMSLNATIEILERSIIDANATRYLSAIGLVMLFYDHLLTFDDEVRLVWKAKPSMAKKLFLLNRYVVLGVLIAQAYFMNHFSDGSTISVGDCKRFYSISPLVGVMSMGIANVLVLLRVIMLWDRDPRVIKVMAFGFVVSFLSTFSLMVVVVYKIQPYISYQPLLRMCVLDEKFPEYAAVWGTPMLFEVLVLTCVCWNAIDKPRSRDAKLTRVLHRDGIAFFLALTILRTFNLVVAVVAQPSLVLLGIFFIWAATTLVLNRSLLNILKAASAHYLDTIVASGLPKQTRTGSTSLSMTLSKSSGYGGSQMLHELNTMSYLPAGRSESPFGIEVDPDFGEDWIDSITKGLGDDNIWAVELQSRAR